MIFKLNYILGSYKQLRITKQVFEFLDSTNQLAKFPLNVHSW